MGWGPVLSVAFRFVFLYWLLYSLSLILTFPSRLLGLIVTQAGLRTEATGEWLSQGMRYLGYPSYWFHQAMNWFTPWVSEALLGVETSLPTDISGSGDRLYAYCTAFAYLVLAAAATVVWTAASELWKLRTHRRPDYGRMHTLMRLIVRFHLMVQMLVYGGMKVWCNQFPPISEGQLEVKYGDSSPMGLLWRFMQFSQPYTAFTGIVEFTCGLLLICRRTTLLGALCSGAATFQVFMLNMCFDVPVKLMSGHLVLMALTLTAGDAKRLLSFFVLDRPVGPPTHPPLFGGWRRLNRVGTIVRVSAFLTYAALTLHQYYQEAITRGILAPANPAVGRWVGREFVRDGQKVPFPPQPDNPPPKQVTPPKWQGGPGMPAVIRAFVGPYFMTLMFEDGSGASFRNTSDDRSEMVLSWMQGGRPAGRLQVSFPEPEVMVLEGPFGGQDVRMTLRKIPAPQKEHLLKARGFRWVQEHPFNR